MTIASLIQLIRDRIRRPKRRASVDQPPAGPSFGFAQRGRETEEKLVVLSDTKIHDWRIHP